MKYREVSKKLKKWAAKNCHVEAEVLIENGITQPAEEWPLYLIGEARI